MTYPEFEQAIAQMTALPEHVTKQALTLGRSVTDDQRAKTLADLQQIQNQAATALDRMTALSTEAEQISEQAHHNFATPLRKLEEADDRRQEDALRNTLLP
ncbi:MAG: hypothetical protein AAB489_04060 [Patescibacteria group bacterium]